MDRVTTSRQPPTDPYWPPTAPYWPHREHAVMTTHSAGWSPDMSPSSHSDCSEPKKWRKPCFAHWVFGNYNIEFLWCASYISSRLANPNITKPQWGDIGMLHAWSQKNLLHIVLRPQLKWGQPFSPLVCLFYSFVLCISLSSGGVYMLPCSRTVTWFETRFLGNTNTDVLQQHSTPSFLYMSVLPRVLMFISPLNCTDR